MAKNNTWRLSFFCTLMFICSQHIAAGQAPLAGNSSLPPLPMNVTTLPIGPKITTPLTMPITPLVDTATTISIAPLTDFLTDLALVHCAMLGLFLVAIPSITILIKLVNTFPHAPHVWQNPLHLTSFLNSSWLTSLALKLGANPLEKDIDGNTGLHYAATFGASNAVATMLQALKKKETTLVKLINLIKVKNNYGTTPFEKASDQFLYGDQIDHLSNSPILRRTLESFVSFFQQVNENKEETVFLFWDAHENKGSLLHRAVKRGKIKQVQFLLDHLRLNSTIPLKTLKQVLSHKYYDETPLSIATKKGNLELIKLLVHDGASIKQKLEDKKTLLHKAAENTADNPAVVTYFLDQKLPIDSKDTQGWTPLHVAAEQGNINCIHKLIERHANLNALTIGRRDTPLHIAITNLLDKESKKWMFEHWTSDKVIKELKDIQNLKATIRLLTKSGAALTIKNEDGKTPQDLLNPTWLFDFKKEMLPPPETDGRLVLTKDLFFKKVVYPKLLKYRLLLDAEAQKQKPSLYVPLHPPLSGGEIVACKKMLSKDCCKAIGTYLPDFFTKLEAISQLKGKKVSPLSDIKIFFNKHKWN